jgi:hypothetical protein
MSIALFVWTYQQNQQSSSSVFLSQQTSEQCFQHNKPAKRTGCMMAAGERRRAVDAVGSRRPYRQRQRVVSSPMVRPIAQYLRPIENMFFFLRSRLDCKYFEPDE